jgi:hypothetical protein
MNKENVCGLERIKIIKWHKTKSNGDGNEKRKYA